MPATRDPSEEVDGRLRLHLRDLSPCAMTDSWTRTLAEWLCTTHAERLMPEVSRAASRATFDSVACALGAVDEPPSTNRAPRGAVPERDPRELAHRRRAQTSVLHAILYNGTLIRALDCNDVFFKNGVMGHPSDNIAVALAFAEREHASARDYLSAVTLGYELYWRLQTNVFKKGAGYGWDHVSVSGLVAAAMAGLLLRLNDERLAHALAIGGAQVYSLSELRSGEISMMKAAANSMTAHTGALGALLAAEGMTGPDALFEGSQGLMVALGKQPDQDIESALTAPVERWHIMDVSIKQYPAIGTSQSAISAVLDLVREYQLRPEDVAECILAYRTFRLHAHRSRMPHVWIRVRARRRITACLSSSRSPSRKATLALTGSGMDDGWSQAPAA